MGDPFALFAAAESWRQESIKTLWPELYNVLAKTDEPEGERVVRCAVYKTHPTGEHFRRAVGRLTEDGPPACLECIAKAAKRPGGYPLKREALT